MAQSLPSSSYTVQEEDTLASIAQATYGDESLWHEIHLANIQVIGDDPYRLCHGMTLYIPANPRRIQSYMTVQSCTVTVEILHVRARPNTGSVIIDRSRQGSVLNFTWTEEGEPIGGNPLWGHSTEEYYFWMGGTDRPEG